eukprot:CAMPEP_0171201730 /NCGR_PEP_ID=MMETSP0790-20130122/24638_1 /TAXON_ID=2925 /ORGANISM="Alexandrium catenella, Strain OF101" /LENGTH=34 /DNA_ID= /DNA_START= /DNA_END= /DNA_ORIENTATION=
MRASREQAAADDTARRFLESRQSPPSRVLSPHAG